MKIAFVTDDERSISAHFGRAKYYVVFEVEDGTGKGRQLIERAAKCGCGGEHDHEHHDHEHHHGNGHSGEKHQQMFAPIADCEVLVARGMGQGAQRGLQQIGIQAVMTDLTEIDAALEAYLGGTLQHNPKRVH